MKAKDSKQANEHRIKKAALKKDIVLCREEKPQLENSINQLEVEK